MGSVLEVRQPADAQARYALFVDSDATIALM